MIRPWVHFLHLNVCFAFMPKVANSAMKVAFAQLHDLSGYDEQTGRGIHSYYQGVAPDEIIHLTCPKIIFVRNPFDRLVSAWQSKLIDKKSHPGFTRFGMKADMSFQEFAEIVCNIPDDKSDHHFRSQTYEMFVNDEPLDLMLGRFEHLDDCWDDVQTIIPALPDLQKIGASKHGDYRLYYNNKLIDMVSIRYQKDLTDLQYEFE